MISYSIAQKLEAADFPQIGEKQAFAKWMLPDGTFLHYSMPADVVPADGVYAPTVTELMQILQGYSTFRVQWQKKHNSWRALVAENWEKHADAYELEDALALLWLDLNPKEA